MIKAMETFAQGIFSSRKRRLFNQQIYGPAVSMRDIDRQNFPVVVVGSDIVGKQ
jgi:hypothetical protein